MFSLGQILKNKELENTALQIAAAMHAEKSASTIIIENRAKLRAYMHELSMKISDSIRNTGYAPDITHDGSCYDELGRLMGLDDLINSFSIEDKRHPYNDLWRSFTAWAEAQGLHVTWKHHSIQASSRLATWFSLDITFKE